MKKAVYFFLVLFLLAGCRKALLDSYGKKFYGTWENTAIEALDGGDKTGLVFKGGTFELQENGFFRYTDTYRNVYEGSWKLYEDYDMDAIPMEMVIRFVIRYGTVICNCTLRIPLPGKKSRQRLICLIL